MSAGSRPPKGAWLTVLGLDAAGTTLPAHGALLRGARLVVGGARHLDLAAPLVDGAETATWARPLSDTVDRILAARGAPVVVLATGDPMSFGIGVTLARHVPPAEMTVIPAPSAFALACARLGWAREAVDAITLHGRPLALLRAALAPGARILALSHDGDTPRHVAALLAADGWGPSRLIALSDMGAAAERRHEGTAADWPHGRIADLNTLAIEALPGPDARILGRSPGLPDDAFAHDGQMTKREARALALARLRPAPGALLWDVGAGCGSISIEWLRAAPGYPARHARAVAVERDPARCRLIAANAERLGTPLLQVVTGPAPDALAALDPPDVVFVGGGLAAPGLLEACLDRLSPGGRLVAHAVTLEGEARLLAMHAARGGDLTRIAVARAAPLGPVARGPGEGGPRTGWRPAMPVTQWALELR